MSSDGEKTIRRIEDTLLTYCRQQGLFKSGDRVIVACSGGADSMALLLFLLRRRRDLEIEVLATHVNHGIRGVNAVADANFVTAFCRQNGVELFLYDAVREGVDIPQQPSEEWARGLRYGWFDQLAVQEEAFIATAHTMSDQVETVLFRMARGTGVHGLAGIPPRRGYYVRPCLCLTRGDTEVYCEALGQNYVQDETNAQDTYARNRIRHDAIPALQYANPSAEIAIARLCRQMRDLDVWLTGEAAALLQAATVEEGYDVATLRRAEGPVLDTALHSLVSPVRDAEEKYITLLRFLLQRGEGALQLTPEVTYKVKDGTLLRQTPQGIKPPPAPPQPFSEGRFFLPGGYFVEFRRVKYEEFLKNQPIFKKDLNCCADCAKIQKNLLLRTRLPGDFFRPAGRHVRKTLKKLYNEMGIPQEERPLLPLLADGSEVLWLWGCGFAEGVAPDSYTNEVLTVRTEKAGED
ncbi:MAG: tRNA lysidine(34) synthetase TilS [Gemmiger sp.]|uniref:tRNA lysidine(34) synthetase TilS n=1 Tax=Subdoligranulum variabile TaxID=214851 RepID=UPI0026F2CE8C|nr:tRNA lysidine(34) synthetase TilS [Subdoligranulum variabile]